MEWSNNILLCIFLIECNLIIPFCFSLNIIRGNHTRPWPYFSRPGLADDENYDWLSFFRHIKYDMLYWYVINLKVMLSVSLTSNQSESSLSAPRRTIMHGRCCNTRWQFVTHFLREGNTRGEAPSFWPLFTIRRRGCVREVYCSSMCWRINPSRLVPVNALSLMKETCKFFKN